MKANGLKEGGRGAMGATLSPLAQVALRALVFNSGQARILRGTPRGLVPWRQGHPGQEALPGVTIKQAGDISGMASYLTEGAG